MARQFPLSASTALVVCAHTDDELGCSATMVRLLEAGTRVRYLALSRCTESVPPGLPGDVLVHECLASSKLLGLAEADVEIVDFPVRRFPEYRQNILDALIEVRSECNPDLVLLPSSEDMHQDHATVYAEGFRAFKHSTILGFEMPQNCRRSEAVAFVPFDKAVLDVKLAAFAAYASQAHRTYASPDYITSLARVRGLQCNAEFAEAFEVIRLVLR